MGSSAISAEEVPSTDDAGLSVVVVHSQPMVAEAIGAVLRKEPGFEVNQHQTATALDAIGLVTSAKPDVSLLDYWMPDIEGAAAVRLIRARDPAARVILISWLHGLPEIRNAAHAGAAGLLPTTISLSEFVDAIRRANAGERPLLGSRWNDLDQVQMVVEAGPLEQAWEGLTQLSDRELQVLQLLSLNAAAETIGRVLGIKEATVRAHIRNIVNKTGTGSRREALTLARECGVTRN